SGDGSAEAARAAGARVVALERNAGFAGGCHAGVHATTAPLLLFLNPDARLGDGALAALRRAAAERPRWGAWQALVTLPGGERVNSAGNPAHWLGLGWAGGHGRPVAEVNDRAQDVATASGA